MIIFRNELPIDHEESIKHIVHSWSKEVYKEDVYNRLCIECVEFCNGTLAM